MMIKQVCHRPAMFQLGSYDHTSIHVATLDLHRYTVLEPEYTRMNGE